MQDIADVVADVQLQARSLFAALPTWPAKSIPVAGLPLKFSDGATGPVRPPPEIGEHNVEVYCDWLGLSPEELVQLESEGVV